MILGLSVFLFIAVFGPRLLSQTAGSGGPPDMPDFERLNRMSPQERAMYFRRKTEEQYRKIEEFRKMAEQQEAQAIKQSLGADEQQWKIIEPKLKKVRTYRDQAAVSIGLPFQSSGFTSSFSSPSGQGGGGGQAFGGFGGGFQFQTGGGQGMTTHSSSPWENLDRPMTDGERICEELQRLLQNPGAGPDQISLKLEALRKAREKAKKQLVKAQQELRKVLNFRQQARLVLMGLLD
jgi:hypothetical protein